jgi:hypothetical protein
MATAQFRHVSTPNISLAKFTSVTDRDPEPRLAELVRDVRDVVRHLEAPAAREPLYGAVARCNASLEHCLEIQRNDRDREASLSAAREELKRLSRLLTIVDPADVTMVMRQIRRVLGRFDSV